MTIETLFQEFVQLVPQKQLFVEGFAVGDGKRVLLEHRFTPDLPRNIYSHTKSYMSTAAGIAISDGVLRLDDKLADFFPEKLPENPQPELLAITLRHLLTMSSGFHKPYLMNEDRRAGTGAPDYMAYMLSRPVLKQPGEAFLYSTADSILAGRMVEKATGKRLGEFLYERLFTKLGHGFPMWDHDPQGHPIGGGGMCLKLTEMMKLGQLYLNNGVWNGEQLLDPAWVREATRLQIDSSPALDVWNCGYGYQFWLSPYPDSYRADGAFGQITTVLPQKGLVVSIQCPEYGDFARVRDTLHEEFFTRL